MPLDDSIISREKDGSLNEDYCQWCYADGTYTYSDMDDLIDVCVGHMVNENFTEEQARAYMKEMLPKLDYWKRYEELSDDGEFEAFKRKLIEEINDLRESLKKGDEKLLAHFGFVNHSKRLDLILKAMAELKKENNLNSRLVIVGDFSQERCGKELFSELTDIIKQNGLEDNITVTGYIEGNVGDYFRASDSAIMLFSNGVSVRNGSVLAGQQEGVKIITSKPVRKIDVFKEQFYFVDNDVDSVKRAIEIVQNEDRKTYPLGDDFSWDAICDKHLSVYNELINR
jgi:glycosyltransferase involved in cell wall biosynthesis